MSGSACFDPLSRIAPGADPAQLDQKKAPDERPMLALGLRLAAALALSTLYLIVKLAAATGISLPEIMFWRQAATPVVIAAMLAATGRLDLLRTRRLKSQAGRAASGMLGMVFNFGAAILLPLAVATILGFTTPLFAVVLSALVLKEDIGRWRWLSVALGFAGVVVIARPGNLAQSPLGIPPLGLAVGLMSGFMLAVISIQLRDLGRTERPIATVFWFGLFGSIATGLVLPFVIAAHDAWQWLLVAGLGFVGLVTQLLLTASLRYGPVGSVIVMDYTAILWTTLYGWRVFGTLPPAHAWAGAPLIVAAGLVIAWRETRAHRARSGAVAVEGQ